MTPVTMKPVGMTLNRRPVTASVEPRLSPLARAIWRFERRIPRDKDWPAEQDEFELAVPLLGAS